MTDKFYEVGYADYDEESFVQLRHTETFTNEQLEGMILQCLPELWEQQKAELANLPGEPEGIDIGYAAAQWDTPGLVEKVIPLLVERFGFQKVEFAARYQVRNKQILYNDDEEGGEIDRLREAARLAVPDWQERIDAHKAEFERLFAEIDAEDDE